MRELGDLTDSRRASPPQSLPPLRPIPADAAASERWTPRRLVLRASEVARAGGPRVLGAKVAGELGTRRVILYESTRPPVDPLVDTEPGVALDALRVGEEAAYLDLDPTASACALRARLESGERCFVARAGSRTVAASWVSLDTARVDHARVAIDLRPGEAYVHGVTTAHDWRRRGVGKAVFRAAQAALWNEGIRRTYSVAVPEHPSSLALNAACAEPVALLTRLRLGSRIQIRVRPLGATSLDWDAAAERSCERAYLDPGMASVKRREHLDLLHRWCPWPAAGALLKTDLWEEGVAGDELLFTLAGRFARVHGLDVSRRVVAAAGRAAARAGAEVDLVQADIRDIPMPSESVDVVLSTSTIDHLDEQGARQQAVAELHRVLTPGGTLIISVDNAQNAGDPLLRLANRLGAVPFPLGPSMSLADLQLLVARAGFDVHEHAYVVAAPRVVATAAVRALRRLPKPVGDPAVDALLRMFAAAGNRAPRRLGCFVAVRAVKPADAAQAAGHGGVPEFSDL